MTDPAAQTQKTSVHKVSGRRHGECYDVHPAVIAQLNDRWRVIDSGEAPPHRQWILQYGKRGKNYWIGKSFCQQRAALLRCIREKAFAARAQAVIRALPEVIT